MKLIVTGGAGFIGSTLVRLLIDRGHDVLNVDRLSYASSVAALSDLEGSARYEFAHADIRVRSEVTGLLSRFEPDAVLHLAAETHVDRSIDDPTPFAAHNVGGTLDLLEVVRKYWAALPPPRRSGFRFLHVSTDEVFGALELDDPPFGRETPYCPRSPYAASKAAADHLVRAWHTTYGLPTIVTHCGNNYGPFQFPEKLIPLMTIKALRGEILPVYGRGQNVRDWIHVGDHARALLAAIERGRPGHTYLIGAAAERSNIQVVEAICAELDRLRPRPSGPRRPLIRFVDDRPGHDFRYALDAARTRQELGWAPHIAFADGLRDTVRWYVDHEDWWQPILAGSYDGRRLGNMK